MTTETPTRTVLIEAFRARFGIAGIAPEQLDLALTHRSHAYEHGGAEDNERLEFLGDAILGAVTSEHLFLIYPGLSEGELSKRRANLVSRAELGNRAHEMGLADLLLLGVGELRTGGNHRRSILGGALEALVAAAYLGLGYEATREFVLEHVIGPLIERSERDPMQGDYKSGLQEWSQQAHGCLPSYRRMGETGPDHNKTFIIQVEVRGEPLATGTGTRVKQAENEAARLALEKVMAEGGGLPGSGAASEGEHPTDRSDRTNPSDSPEPPAKTHKP